MDGIDPSPLFFLPTAYLYQAKFIPLCNTYFPGFSIVNIGFSLTYSQQFLAVPESGFNVLQASFVSPYGRRFIRELHAHRRQTYSWTVNDEKNMDWCIRRGLDGIVTDDIPKLLDMCALFQVEKKHRWQVKMLLGFTYFNFWVYLFSTGFRSRYGTCIDRLPEVDKNK